jgi:peptidoglycan/xylan/chitin deacetylase (PgdA/CDA1 family)
MRTAVRLGGAAAGVTAAYFAGPALASIQPVRRALTPTVLPASLSGVHDGAHVALTFDDGPDRTSTPAFLDLLARHGVRATFFLLGSHAVDEPDLLRRMAAEGHELAVHGWTHRCVMLLGRRRLTRELCMTREVLERVTGSPVVWYRPPYGVLTGPALVAARAAGLRTVLWSAWGVDWRQGRTPEQVVATVCRDLRPGGTVLLHDSDRTSASGSWRATLPATDLLLRRLSAEGVPVGPLAARTVTAEPVPAA